MGCRDREKDAKSANQAFHLGFCEIGDARRVLRARGVVARLARRLGARVEPLRLGVGVRRSFGRRSFGFALLGLCLSLGCGLRLRLGYLFIAHQPAIY